MPALPRAESGRSPQTSGLASLFAPRMETAPAMAGASGGKYAGVFGGEAAARTPTGGKYKDAFGPSISPPPAEKPGPSLGDKAGAWLEEKAGGLKTRREEKKEREREEAKARERNYQERKAVQGLEPIPTAAGDVLPPPKERRISIPHVDIGGFLKRVGDGIPGALEAAKKFVSRPEVAYPLTAVGSAATRVALARLTNVDLGTADMFMGYLGVGGVVARGGLAVLERATAFSVRHPTADKWLRRATQAAIPLGLGWSAGADISHRFIDRPGHPSAEPTKEPEKGPRQAQSRTSGASLHRQRVMEREQLRAAAEMRAPVVEPPAGPSVGLGGERFRHPPSIPSPAVESKAELRGEPDYLRPPRIPPTPTPPKPPPEVTPPIPSTTTITGAEVSGSVVEGTLTYAGQPWQLLDNGTRNADTLLQTTRLSGTIDKDAMARNLQRATELWTHGQLDQTRHPDLWKLFHLSNGTKTVFDKLLNNATIESLRSLAILR